MPALHRAPDQLYAALTLGGAFPVIFKAKGGVAAYLPQPCELCQNPEPVLLVVRLREKIPDMQHLRVIQLLLAAFHRGVLDLLQFFRKFLQNVLLQPAENKGRYHSFQLLRLRLIPASDDRSLDLPPESLVIEQETRHQEIKNAPQIAEPVLDRRACQGEPGLPPQKFHRPSRRCSGVFNILCLIEDNKAKFSVLVSIDVSFQKIIRGDQNIHIPVFFVHRLNHITARSRRPCNRANLQFRCEPPELLAPVVNQRCGSHNHRNPVPLQRREQRNDLQRFPQTHIVSQNSAKSAMIQHAEPLIPHCLIRAQHSPERLGHLKVRFLHRSEIPDQRTEVPVPVGIYILHTLHHPVKIQSTVRRDLHFPADEVLQTHLHRIQHHAELRHRIIFLFSKQQEISVLQAEKFLFLPVGLKNIQKFLLRIFIARHLQIQQIVLHGDTDIERNGTLYAEALETLSAAHLADGEQPVEAVLQELTDSILPVVIKQIPLLIIVWEIGFQRITRSDFRIQITIRLKGSVIQRFRQAMPPCVVQSSPAAEHLILLCIQIIKYLRFGRQVSLYFLIIRLGKLCHFSQLRHNLVVKFRQFSAADFHYDIFQPCCLLHRLHQLRQSNIQRRKLVISKRVSPPLPIKALSHASGKPDSQKFPLLAVICRNQKRRPMCLRRNRKFAFLLLFIIIIMIGFQIIKRPGIFSHDTEKFVEPAPIQRKLIPECHFKMGSTPVTV